MTLSPLKNKWQPNIEHYGNMWSSTCLITWLFVFVFQWRSCQSSPWHLRSDSLPPIIPWIHWIKWWFVLGLLLCGTARVTDSHISSVWGIVLTGETVCRATESKTKNKTKKTFFACCDIRFFRLQGVHASSVSMPADVFAKTKWF